MKIPVVTGTGERFDLDTDDYPRLVLLPEACEGIDSRLWELFAEPSAEEPDGLGGFDRPILAPARYTPKS